MEIIQINTVEEMDLVVQKLLTKFSDTDCDRALVIALTGELGAGKTTFTQTLAKTLGVTEPVTSPTYVVMKGYELSVDKGLSHYKKLIHIDAYRIEDIDEMRVLGFSELLKEKDTIICIEWPEHIESLIPDCAIRVSIKMVGGAREISVS